MAEATELEKTAKDAPQQEKKEEPKKMAEKLEDKVEAKESKGFIRKAFDTSFNLAVAGATTALSTAFVGPLGIYIGGAIAGGHVIGGTITKKPLYNIVNDSLKGYSTINAIIHPIIWLGNVTLPLIPNETLFGKAARTLYALTAYNAAFVGAFRGAHHLINNKLNPKGLYKAVTNNFYNEWKRFGMLFAPAYALVANGIYSLAGVPYLGEALKTMPYGNSIGKVPVFAANALPAIAYHIANPLKPAKKSSPSYSPEYSPAQQPA